ncbi:MAG: nucleotide exchange factor GrpE [Clostridia bacterium]|nr:nucleotide exchange factor GrpE [Clostridia bacterium]
MKEKETKTAPETEAEETKAEEAAEAEEKEAAEPEAEDPAAALAKENEALKKQMAEDKDKYLRMAAEYDNYRRRSVKEREAAFGEAYADALMQIIPVIDNLERAAGFGESDPKQLADGVNMILSQFGDVLKKMGIEQFGAEGDKFDPNIHNAIMHEENEELEEDIITAVFQKGYRRGDKIIRPAMVKVAN